MAPPRRVRNVCFTWNNPGPDPIPFDVNRMKYLVYQRERGESGTEHYQGYLELVNSTSFAAIKTLLGNPSIHLEPRRGSAIQASDYCQKEDSRVPGTTPFVFGEISNPGKRTDLLEFKDAVMSGQKRKRDLVDDHFGILARYPKFYETLTMLNRPTRSDENPLSVYLHIGVPGTGKTRAVYDEHQASPEFYVAPLSNGTTWYDTYDGHKTVLIDDFAGKASHCTLVALLRLLDRYPVLLPTKGSHTWWLPSTIYITTNIRPSLWYTWTDREAQFRALARRFTHVIEFHTPVNENDNGRTHRDAYEYFKEDSPAECLSHFEH